MTAPASGGEEGGGGGGQGGGGGRGTRILVPGSSGLGVL